jgi:hypothetical protein
MILVRLMMPLCTSRTRIIILMKNKDVSVLKANKIYKVNTITVNN